ncbi:hypothetical protein [Nonomuraea candida]|uniref:hypothetical protein n=1 Tax=Nonomuraea candida TaxID=359159 RepID=UPI000693F04A|nr:hypothetical protein [Nonomuraea candida]
MLLRRGHRLTMAGARRTRSPAFTVAMTVVAVFILYLAVPNVGTAVRAARADGAPGVFTARELTCVQHPGHESCVWTGRFRADDGSIDRSGVELYGSDRYTNRAGESTRAVDIGLAGRVYGPGGSNEWVLTALLAASGLGILLWLYGAPLRRLRAGRNHPVPAERP